MVVKPLSTTGGRLCDFEDGNAAKDAALALVHTVGGGGCP